MSGNTRIQLKRSNTAFHIPTPTQLAPGEPAINLVDGRLFVKLNSGTVIDISSTPAGNTFYVSQNGNDLFDGKTPGASKRTIRAAVDQTNPGDSVYVHSGLYIEETPIIVPQQVQISGAGERNTIIQPIDPTKDVFWINNLGYITAMKFINYSANAVCFPAEVVETGTARAVTSNTITLANTSTLVDNYYNGMSIAIASGNNQSFIYSTDLSYRDAGSIIDSISFDLLYGGNRQSIQSAVSYFQWSTNTANTNLVIPKDQTACTDAMGHLKLIANNIILGIPVSTYQSAITQNISLTPGTISESELVISDINNILNIIDNGPLVATKSPIKLIPSSNRNVTNAAIILEANKGFIQAELNAYLSDTYSSFNYDQTKSSRDTGLIVDAIAMDMLHGTTSDSNFTGLQYWKQDSGYTGNIALEVSATSNAISYLETLALTYISPQNQPAVISLFNTIKNIFANGATSVSNSIVYGGLPTSDTTIINDVLVLQNNISVMQNEVLSYITSPTGLNFTNFNQTTCSRDVGYILNAICFDLQNGGNVQSTKSGVYYFGYNGAISSIPNDMVQCTAAINFISGLIPSIVTRTAITNSYQSDVVQDLDGTPVASQISVLQNNIEIITNIINNGPSVSSTKTPQNFVGTLASDNINTWNLLHKNRAYIVAEVNAFINYNNTYSGFTYDIVRSSRDAGLIINAIGMDLLYNSNSDSTFTGLQYWKQDTGYTGNVASQVTATVTAINHLRGLALSFVSPQNFDRVNNLFYTITNVFTNGTDGIVDTIVYGGLPTTDTTTLSDVAILQTNLLAMQKNVIAWINSNYSAMIYNQTTCFRDVGYIINSICFDLRNGGNLQSTKTGVYYYGYDGVNSAIPNNITECTAGINFIGNIVANVVTGTLITNTYQFAVAQNRSGTWASANVGVTLANSISLITNIINNGPSVAPAKTPQSLVENTDSDVLNAWNMLQANYNFIVAEVNAFIDNQFTNKFVYNESNCYRDTGLIVDAIGMDLLYNTTSDSIFTGLQYWNQDVGFATPELGAEITYTGQAVAYLESLVVGLVDQQNVPNIINLFSRIVQIIFNGPANITNTIIYGGLVTSNTVTLADVSTIQANKTSLAQSVINYITSPSGLNFTNFNQTTCSRDVGYILDSVCFDLQTGGNLQSIKAGIYYYGYDGTDSVVPNESVQVNDAYNFIANIASNIVTGTLIVDPYQTTVTQNTSGIFASSNVVTTLANNISVITNIINNGPAVVTTKTPQSLTQTTNQNTINAWNMLHNNRAFIQAEVLAYFNNTNPQVTYDKTKSLRDTGLIVDALVQDLLFDTNSQSTFAGLQYWKQNGYTGNFAEKISTCIGAIEYVSTLAQKIITGDFTGTRQQTLYRQMTANTATNNEVNLISTDFSLITNILNNGTSNVTNMIVPNSIVANTNTHIVNAYNLLQLNKSYLQAEASAWIESNKFVNQANIISYSADTQIAVIDQNWNGLPDNNCTYNLSIPLLNSAAPATARYSTYITGSPYIYNSSSINSLSGTGLCIDGSRCTGNKSMISSQFTQVNTNGTGVRILNDGYCQLVSIYAIFNNKAFLAETGGTASMGNCNVNFGKYGLYASGYGKIVMSGLLNGTQAPFNFTVNINNIITDSALSVAASVPYSGLLMFVGGDSSGTYYNVTGSTQLDINGSTQVSLLESNNITFAANTPVYFYQQSQLRASGQTFEFCGAGTSIDAIPRLGGVANSQLQITAVGGAAVFATSTDENGNFQVGDLILDQATSTISGRTFSKSLFAEMTPYILALEG